MGADFYDGLTVPRLLAWTDAYNERKSTERHLDAMFHALAMNAPQELDKIIKQSGRASASGADYEPWWEDENEAESTA